MAEIMKIAFMTALGVLVGILMVIFSFLGGGLVMLVNYPAFLVCAALSMISSSNPTGTQPFFYDVMVSAIVVQWAIIGAIVGTVMQIRSRKKMP